MKVDRGKQIFINCNGENQAKHEVISIPQCESTNKIQKMRCKIKRRGFLTIRISHRPERHPEAKAVLHCATLPMLLSFHFVDTFST